jgi:hypothetical protein
MMSGLEITVRLTTFAKRYGGQEAGHYAPVRLKAGRYDTVLTRCALLGAIDSLLVHLERFTLHDSHHQG